MRAKQHEGSAVLYLRLPPGLKRAIDTAAREEGRNTAEFVRRALADAACWRDCSDVPRIAQASDLLRRAVPEDPAEWHEIDGLVSEARDLIRAALSDLGRAERRKAEATLAMVAAGRWDQPRDWDLLIEAARLPFDQNTRRDMRMRAAQLATVELGDNAAAIDMYRSVLAASPAEP